MLAREGGGRSLACSVLLLRSGLSNQSTMSGSGTSGTSSASLVLAAATASNAPSIFAWPHDVRKRRTYKSNTLKYYPLVVCNTGSSQISSKLIAFLIDPMETERQMHRRATHLRPHPS